MAQVRLDQAHPGAPDPRAVLDGADRIHHTQQLRRSLRSTHLATLPAVSSLKAGYWLYIPRGAQALTKHPV